MVAPTREHLQSLKRSELQKLCKEYGVKANMKSDALIDLLLDTTSQSNQLEQPRHTRSTSHSKLRSAAPIHIQVAEDEKPTDEQPQSESESKIDPPPTRTTRKAKETQFRLGVGKPKLVGGRGARAVTKAITVPKGKRSVTKFVKPSEEDIVPEPEHPIHDHQTPSEPGPSGAEHDHPIQSHQPQTTETPLYQSLENINEYVNELVRPLQEQIRSFKSDLERLNTQVAELLEAKRTLTNQVESLRGQTERSEEELSKLKDKFDTRPPNRIFGVRDESLYSSQAPSAPDHGHTFGVPLPPSSTQSSIPGMMFSNHPMPTTLGKRHRDSPTSDQTGGETPPEEAAQKINKPHKKRAKLEDGRRAGPSQEPNSGPGFTVFSGPEERSDFMDPPPPTTHLSDLFGHHSPVTPGNDIRTTNTANAPENHNPFGLSFSAYQAVTSTPAYATNGLASYLERPESPTSHVIERAGRHDRASPFFLHGSHPSRITPPNAHATSSHPERADNDTMSALLKTPPLHAVRDGATSSDVGFGMGMADIRMEDTPAPPVKRTMYGTELEADTRFGDFGVEGIASGFWQGPGQRRF